MTTEIIILNSIEMDEMARLDRERHLTALRAGKGSSLFDDFNKDDYKIVENSGNDDDA